MADPISMLAVGSMGASVVGGIMGAAGAQTKAQGSILGIQGQMLNTLGQAYNFDVESQQFGWDANISDYQKQVALENEKIAKSNADYARAVGDVQAEESGLRSRAELAQIKATQGAMGLDVNSGSTTAVRSSAITLGAYDQSVIRSNAARVAYGYEVEATQAEAQAGIYGMTADLQRAQAANAQTAKKIALGALPLEQQAIGVAAAGGDISAMGSLVGAAGSVADKWLAGKQQGLWGTA